MPQVLVTDARSKACVSIVRSLGEKGIDVVVGNERLFGPAFFSKHVKKRFIYPNPEKYPREFLTTVHSIIKKDKYDMIIPVRDSTTMIVSKFSHILTRHTNIFVPSYPSLMLARDKGQTMIHAEKQGIPCPKTFIEEIHGDITKVENYMEFPVLVKARESSGSRGIGYVDSPQKLAKIYREIKSKFGKVMIQEYIPSKEYYCVATLFDESSNLKAAYVMRKIRCFPPSGGPASFGVSVNRPDLIEISERLLKSIKWKGVAELDFVMDPRDGKPKLLEINPRFWDHLSLGISLNIDFPYLLYKLALNEKIENNISTREGKVWRYLIYEVLYSLKTKDMGPIYEILKGSIELNDAIYLKNDMGPFVGTLIDGFASIFSNERLKHIFGRGW